MLGQGLTAGYGGGLQARTDKYPIQLTDGDTEADVGPLSLNGVTAADGIQRFVSRKRHGIGPRDAIVGKKRVRGVHLKGTVKAAGIDIETQRLP